jgi:hypothetical protein
MTPYTAIECKKTLNLIHTYCTNTHIQCTYIHHTMHKCTCTNVCIHTYTQFEVSYSGLPLKVFKYKQQW